MATSDKPTDAFGTLLGERYGSKAARLVKEGVEKNLTSLKPVAEVGKAKLDDAKWNEALLSVGDDVLRHLFPYTYEMTEDNQTYPVAVTGDVPAIATLAQ